MTAMTETRLGPINAFSPDPTCPVCHGRGNVWDGMHAINCLCITHPDPKNWCQVCDEPIWNIPGTTKWVHIKSGHRTCDTKATPRICGCDRGYTCSLCTRLAAQRGEKASTY